MLIDDNGDSIYTDSELSNHINDYFANIGNKLANKIQIKLTQDTKQVFPQIVLNNNKDNITNNMITHAELMNIVNDIDLSKSSAIKNIRTVVIVDAFKAQFDRILRLYNGSLTRCIFPARWKKGTIVPLPKINIPKTASDLRPISLLPLPGKVLEHIISKRLKAFLYERNILTEKQHGFRKIDQRFRLL